MNVLKTRKLAIGKCHGRRVTPLSRYAQNALRKNKLSQSFWKRWDTKHSSLTRKHQGNVNLNRALNCTREMATEHLNELADELIRLGLFKDAKKIEEGVWEGEIDTGRIYNHDESPQFINYGVDGSANNLVYCGKGEECNRLLRENRECVTIEPFVSLSGNLEMCHVIFKGSCINSHMATKEAVNKLITYLFRQLRMGFKTITHYLQLIRISTMYWRKKVYRSLF